MNSNALGGGILFAAIALLWIVVLVPSLVRSRAFRAAEQNAARLQRTLRILAETAEVPEEHRVEATAKEALAHEKKLKIAKRNLEQARKKEQQLLRQRLKDQQMQAQKTIAASQALLKEERLRSARLKPVRLIAAFVSAFGAIGVVIGAILLFTGLNALVFWVGLGAVVLGASSLVLMAPGARKQTAQQTQHVTERVRTQMPIFESPSEKIDESHLAHARAQAKAKADLDKARALAKARTEARKIAAQNSAPNKENLPGSMLLNDSQPELQKSPPPSSESSLSARLQKMGVVDETVIEEPAITNIDEILKRRRQAG